MEPIRDFRGQPAPEALQPLLRVLDCCDVMELAGMYGEARDRGDEKLKTAISDRMAKLIAEVPILRGRCARFHTNRLDCPNMKDRENDFSMTHEHYSCALCGRRMTLDYEEMK